MNPRQKASQPHSEYAYAAIKELILSGKYAPEHPLVEEALAGLFNIGRTPVREAPAILENEKSISPRGLWGMFVRPVSKNEFILDDIIQRNPDEAVNRAIFHLRSLRQTLADVFIEPEE